MSDNTPVDLRACLHGIDPAETSAAGLASRLGLQSPYTLRDLSSALETRSFSQVIDTPAGTALGGWVKLDLAGNGNWTFSGHLHGSGFDPYNFRIHLAFVSESVTLSFFKSGKVGGTIGGGSRDFDWAETGQSLAVRTSWSQLSDGHVEVAKAYDDAGALGGLEELGKDFLAFLIAQVAAGPTLAAAIVLGAELGQLTDAPFARPDLVAGLLVTGGTVLICGQYYLIPAIIAGYVLGSQIKVRPLSAAEQSEARSVFGDTLPFERIYITNLGNPTNSDRAFTTPQPDGSILINVGNRLNAMLDSAENRKTLIHELVHAWQITYKWFPPEIIGEAAVNDIIIGSAAYDFGADKASWKPWKELNIEAQASAVAFWYELFSNPVLGLDSELARRSIFYDYVANHIRIGQN